MKAELLVIIIFIILIYYIYFRKSGMVYAESPVSFDSNIAEDVEKKYKNIVDSISKKNISSEIILGIICVEAGGLILQGNDSSSIIGDNGKSIGVMQIQESAYKDVNLLYNLNYVYNDLKNDNLNILFGTYYLEDCFTKSVSEGSKNPLQLAIRKYNSGINNAKDTNVVSIDYSNKVISYSKYF